VVVVEGEHNLGIGKLEGRVGIERDFEVVPDGGGGRGAKNVKIGSNTQVGVI